MLRITMIKRSNPPGDRCPWTDARFIGGRPFSSKAPGDVWSHLGHVSGCCRWPTDHPPPPQWIGMIVPLAVRVCKISPLTRRVLAHPIRHRGCGLCHPEQQETSALPSLHQQQLGLVPFLRRTQSPPCPAEAIPSRALCAMRHRVAATQRRSPPTLGVAPGRYQI